MIGIATSLLMLPLSLLAAAWNKVAFDAEKLDEAEKKLEINGFNLCDIAFKLGAQLHAAFKFFAHTSTTATTVF